jgi:tetratricopeptide (TPR) repeat protein
MLKAASLKEAGNDHYKLGEWTEASNLYRQGIAMVEKLYDPNSADEQVKIVYLSLLTNLSMVCLKEKKPSESRDIAAQALSIDATNIKALYRRAMAHRILGDMDNAKKDLKLALQYDPDNLDVKREWALTKQALANQKSKEKALFKRVPIVLYSEKEKVAKDEPKLKIKRVPMFVHSEKAKLSKDESKLKCKSEWEAENSKRMSNGQQAVSFEDWEKQWKAKQEEHKYEPQPWKFENFGLQTSQSMRDVIGAQMDDQLGLSQFMAESGKGLQIAFVGDPSMRERIRDGKVQIRF